MTAGIAVERRPDNNQSRTSGAREAKTTSSDSDLELRTELKDSPDRVETRKAIADAAPLLSTTTQTTQKGTGFLMGFVKGYNQSRDFEGKKTEEINNDNIGEKLNVDRRGLPEITVSKASNPNGESDLIVTFKKNTDDLAAAYFVDLDERGLVSKTAAETDATTGEVKFNFGSAATISSNATLVIELENGAREHISVKELRERAKLLKELTK